MSFNWAEYLSVAETLCGAKVSGPPAGVEAQQRAGVSRAYYSAFISARNRLRDVDRVLVPTSGKSHQFVANKYTNDSDPRRKMIGITLDRLRKDRNKCDYDDTIAPTPLPKVMRRSLIRALQVLNDLSDF